MARRYLLGLAACLAALAVGPHAARAGQCGLPDTTPLWFDYASGAVSFRNEVFGRPGVIAATSGIAVPAELRKRGAQTVYWENKLGLLVGTTSKPADPALIPGRAAKLVERAAAATGCATPVIALNELNGPGTTTPWTATNAAYRANVLSLLRELKGRGSKAYLLLPGAPYTGGEALSWWLQAADLADLVVEVYFHAPRIHRMGVVVGSRQMRMAFRRAIASLTQIGIPPSRLGLVLGFQSGPGTGGREGLQPRSEWLRFVKLQTLAAKQVASELGLGSVWSWGWGTFSAAGADPDKPAAACVYLWARDQSLCDGPAAAGAGFVAALDEGQINLPAAVQCAVDGRRLVTASIDRLAAVTKDRELAFTALFARLVESASVSVPTERILAAERSIVAFRFGGSRPAYVAALKARGATVAIARGVLADQLRRAEAGKGLAVAPPTPGQIALYYTTFPETPVRLVSASPAPSWLGGRRRGFALSPPAPPELVGLPAGRPSALVTAEGTFAVVPLEAALPLGAVPLELAAPAIRAALAAFARATAVERWSTSLQTRAQARAACLRDDLPAVAAVDLSSYLPFLAL